VPVYYAGGDRIDRFRGQRGTEGPEDWVGSVTRFPASLLPAGGDPQTGISALPDGTLLDSAIAADPLGWLGPGLHRHFGEEPGLLVKLLDAGQRLPVHCHPDRTFALEHLSSRFGKNEGWIVIAVEEGALIWLGFARDVDARELQSWIRNQDAETMLATMNIFTPEPGDVFYVPAGVPHSIGPGVMIVELQEPTSFSILAEHRSFGVDDDSATLGLGWDLALSCFDRRGYTGQLRSRLRPHGRAVHHRAGGTLERLYDADAEGYFQAYRARTTGTGVALDGTQFRIIVVLNGRGTLRFSDGHEPVCSGQTWVVPHDVGAIAFDGELEAIVCCPPTV
jgi:mannose-6-phosphate isomerase